MKIGILSRNASLYSTKRLIEACKQRGHEVRVIDALRCYMNINSEKPEIHYKGEELAGFDAIIPRIGASVTFYGTAVLRQFEMMGFILRMNRSRLLAHATNCAPCNYYHVKGSACRSLVSPANLMM